MKPGDILGFSGDGWLSFGINLLTYGIPYYHISHVGIVAELQKEDFDNAIPGIYRYTEPGLYLFEATITSLPGCVLTLACKPGVKVRPIGVKVRNTKGRVWHYPCRHKIRPLESRRLTCFLRSQLGKNYDAIGAFRAAGLGFSGIESRLRKEDLSSLFCSELCAAAYKHIGIMDTTNASKWSPNSLVRYCRKENILLKPRRLK